MSTRRLYHSLGSPFARAVRILLDELGLAFEADIADITDAAKDRALRTPTLQVPTLTDGDLTLWDSGLIAEYLVATYKDRPARQKPRLAAALARPDHEWKDRRLLAAIQTLGESAVLVSQLRWSGTTARDNAFIARNVDRIGYLISWLEAQITSEAEGFWVGELSVPDIFCICHLMFITHRPLEIEWERTRTPRLAALHDRLGARPSFQKHSIKWWEPPRPAELA
jgi:glutathione S-transferase